MARLGEYPTMTELKDEDKWGFGPVKLTKKQILYYGIALGVCFGVISLTSALHVVIIGLEICLLIILATIVVQMKMPADKYLLGGGVLIGELALRVLRKNLKKNRVIYLKFYGEGK